MTRNPPLTANALHRWDIVDRHLRGHGAPRRILEIGMGQGAVGARLSQLGTYTGIEPDPLSRATAQSRLPAGARAIADLDDLGSEETFDLICAFEVLEHIERDADALRAWRAHLEPGGELLLSVPAHPERFGAADDLVGHHRRYAKAQLQELLTEAGFEVLDIQATGFPLGFALEWGRNAVARRRLDRAQTIEQRTAASGRLLQPPDALGSVIAATTYPFRILQRAAARTEVGTGWVVIAHRPRS